MPKRAHDWTALDVKRAAHPDPEAGRRPASFAVGGVAGLHLQVTPGGAKTWLLRVVVGARRREIGLGAYPEISLASARDRAREARDAIRRGVDPVEQRKAARSAMVSAQQRGLTFKEAVERCLAAKTAEFGNAKHAKQWRSTLDAYALPALGALMVSDITVSDVQRALAPIWEAKTETATRLRGRIETVLAWSTVAGHRSGDNPARWKGNLDAILAKPGKLAKVDNHPALALDDVAAWFEALRQREGMAARALEFAALTATRSGEVRGATWAEIDLEKAVWTIPADRMKAGREHRVPLAADSVALLRAQPRFAETEFVFPAARGGALSDMALSAVMRRMHETKLATDAKARVALDRAGWRDPRSGRPAVPHGLRSVFRDWCAERTEWPREMAEIALAHTVGSEVERSYRRSDMVERRRAMMDHWQRFLSGDDGPAMTVIGTSA
jgi:integrase